TDVSRRTHADRVLAAPFPKGAALGPQRAPELPPPRVARRAGRARARRRGRSARRARAAGLVSTKPRPFLGGVLSRPPGDALDGVGARPRSAHPRGGPLVRAGRLPSELPP